VHLPRLEVAGDRIADRSCTARVAPRADRDGDLVDARDRGQPEAGLVGIVGPAAPDATRLGVTRDGCVDAGVVGAGEDEPGTVEVVGAVGALVMLKWRGHRFRGRRVDDGHLSPGLGESSCPAHADAPGADHDDTAAL
jgi:hypothetical protein